MNFVVLKDLGMILVLLFGGVNVVLLLILNDIISCFFVDYYVCCVSVVID